MKKIFPIVRGAVMFLAALTLGFATTSCQDEFDDSELNSRIDDLEDSVSSLESRVAALESSVASMNTQISSLSGMISGLVTVSEVTANADGSYSIELSDGSSFDVPAPAEEEEVVEVPVVGIATDASGAYYWTYDGQPLYDANGNLIYLVQDVTTEVVTEVITPLFQVNTETGELEISVDNGATYTSTGVKLISDDTETEVPSCSCITIFTDFSYDDDYAYFTLADGTTVQVALNASASETTTTTDVNCYALSGKQYFEYGETKEVKLSVSGISKATVTRPDGWKASVSGSKLSITAPAEDNAYAEQEGTVTIIAVASDGRTAIAEVSVGIGTAPVDITVSAESVNLTYNAEAGFDYYVYGVAKLPSLDDFDPQTYYDDWTSSWWLSTNNTDIATTLEDELYGDTVEAGYVYVVYALGVSEDGWSYAFDDVENMIYEVYEPIEIQLEVLSTTIDDAQVKISASGATEWYYYMESADYYDIDGYVSWYLSYAEGYTMSIDNYEGSLAELVSDYFYDGFDFGETYKIAFWPYEEGRTDYTVEEATVFDIQLAPLTYDGTISVTIGDVTATASSVSATVTPAAGTYKSYGYYFSETNYASYCDESGNLIVEDIVAYMMDYYYYTEHDGSESYEVSRSSLSAESKGYIVAIAMDSNGAFGPVAVVEANTTAIAYNENITIAVEATDLTQLRSATISWTPSAEVVSYRYMNMTKSNWTNSSTFGYADNTTTESYLASRTTSSIRTTYNTSVTLTNLTSSTDYVFFILGVDADGNPTRMTTYEYTVGSGMNFIRSTNEDGSANSAYAACEVSLESCKLEYGVYNDTTYGYDYSLVPQSSAEWSAVVAAIDAANNNGGNMRITIDFDTLPSNVSQVYVYLANPDYMADTAWKARTQKIMQNGTSLTGSGVITRYQNFYDTCAVYYTWQDTDGNWYEQKEYYVYENTYTESEGEDFI